MPLPYPVVAIFWLLVGAAPPLTVINTPVYESATSLPKPDFGTPSMVSTVGYLVREVGEGIYIAMNVTPQPDGDVRYDGLVFIPTWAIKERKLLVPEPLTGG